MQPPNILVKDHSVLCHSSIVINYQIERQIYACR